MSNSEFRKASRVGKNLKLKPMRTIKLLSTALAFFIIYSFVPILKYIEVDAEITELNITEKTYTIEELISYATQINNQSIFYFDLDNTLITTNEYGYGSDEWTKVISDSISHLCKTDKHLADEYSNYLYNALTPANFNYLPSKSTSEQLKVKLNDKIDSNIKINGLTSRAKSIESITKQNLQDAGYHEFNVISTTGGNKGKFIYKAYMKNGIKNIVYVDDTKKKLDDAKNVLDTLLKDEKNVNLELIHLDNKNIEKFSEVQKHTFWKNFTSSYQSYINVKDI